MSPGAESRLAAPGVWEKVLSMLGECVGAKILDSPAGSGLLSAALAERGGTVVSLDLSPGRTGGANWVQANLNANLPFREGQFDRIVSVEGIEHLENPSFLLREFARVLKPGGILILTTPNVQNLRSRIKFALTGNLFWFDEYAVGAFGHVAPQLFFLLQCFAEQAGFDVEEITTNRRIAWMHFLSLPLRVAGAVFRGSQNSSALLAGEIHVLKFRYVGARL